MSPPLVVAIGVTAHFVSTDEYEAQLLRWRELDRAAGRAGTELMDDAHIAEEVARYGGEEGVKVELQPFAKLASGEIIRADDEDGSSSLTLGGASFAIGDGDTWPPSPEDRTQLIEHLERFYAESIEEGAQRAWKGWLRISLGGHGIQTSDEELERLPFTTNVDRRALKRLAAAGVPH